MNEYDTFLKLKKINFLDLRTIINQLSFDKAFELRDNPVLKEEFLNSYGWKSDEFDKAAREMKQL